MDEEIKTQRKQWQKPELIVLVRSKPEEAVLQACKQQAHALNHGSAGYKTWCTFNQNGGCAGCLSTASS